MPPTVTVSLNESRHRALVFRSRCCRVTAGTCSRPLRHKSFDDGTPPHTRTHTSMHILPQNVSWCDAVFRVSLLLRPGQQGENAKGFLGPGFGVARHLSTVHPVWQRAPLTFIRTCCVVVVVNGISTTARIHPPLQQHTHTRAQTKHLLPTPA